MSFEGGTNKERVYLRG